MLILEENNKKFNEKVDSITVFIRKVFNSEMTVKEIENNFLRFVEEDCERLLSLIHNILLDIQICAKIEYIFKLLVIILNQKSNPDLESIKYVFEDLYMNFKYMYEHLLYEASINQNIT